MVDRVSLVNLKRRPDRLAHFRKLQQEKGWELPEPIIFEAIEGNKVGVPSFFTQGGGAFGCRQSHISILERAIMDDVNTVLVLEDDVEWFSDAWERLKTFMAKVPKDWQQLMLGGQHIRSPGPISEGVVKVNNCQRTHAYVLRGQAVMKSLLDVWYKCNVHIDWKMGEWQRDFKVYAPDPFIFGQGAGRSDISGRTSEAKFWIPPKEATVIHLACPKELLPALRGRGLHMGFTRNSDDLDAGLCEVVKLSGHPRVRRLKNWLDTVTWEAASIEGGVTTVYHPDITLAEVQALWPNVIEVKGQTLAACVHTLKDINLKPNFSTTHILLLRAPRAVADGLGGFHFGYWRDPISGQDNGLRDIASRRDRKEKIKEWLALVGAEAEKISAVPCIWHPEIKIEDIETDRKVVEISADSIDEVMSQWRENR